MAEHENLAGGLIGAGGALFAGWLAWSAIREQIDLEQASTEPEVVNGRASGLPRAARWVMGARLSVTGLGPPKSVGQSQKYALGLNGTGPQSGTA
jgi:hypothetical protein